MISGMQYAMIPDTGLWRSVWVFLGVLTYEVLVRYRAAPLLHVPTVKSILRSLL